VTADTTRPVRPRPAPADDDASDAEDLAGEDRRPRYTMWAGGIAAFALVALALWGGAHLSVLVPGMHPAWLAGIVGVCLAWLVIAVLGWCAAELLKTHHRAMRAAAWRGARSGAGWAWQTGRHHGGRAVVWAGGRWQQRDGDGGPPSMFGRLLAALTGGGEDDGEPCPSCGAGPAEQCADGCKWRTEPCPVCQATAGEACAAGCSGGRPGAGDDKVHAWANRWRLIGTDRYLTDAELAAELDAHRHAGAEVTEVADRRMWVASAILGDPGGEFRYERIRVPAGPGLAPGRFLPPLPAEETAADDVPPAPEPAPGDQAGRTVYMTRVRLAAGGTETAK
jgi:hypothetical protein